MPPNALVVTSTPSQEYYDINYVYTHHPQDVLQHSVDPIGMLFGNRAARQFHYAGQASILAVLNLVWPLLVDGTMSAWQEMYVYQNSYPNDPPGTATIHTRHSFSPGQWFSQITEMEIGHDFYYHFWDFLVEPLYQVASRSLNYVAYKPHNVQDFLGVQEWLWPAFGDLDMDVLRVAVLRSWRGDALYRVPLHFLDTLRAIIRQWRPRTRL